MKIKVKKNDVLKALVHCLPIVGNKNVMPILDNVIIESKDGILSFRTSSLNTEVTYSINIEDKGDFIALLPCQLLFNAIKSIREDEITLESVEKEAGGSTVKIKTKKGRSKIEGYNPKDFPKKKMPELPEHYITFKTAKGLEDLKYAMSYIKVEDLRPYLSCLSLRLEGDTLTSVAMCNIAGVRQFTEIHNPFSMSFVANINKDVLSNAIKTSSGSGMNMYVTDKMFAVKYDGYTFVGDLYTEVAYPKVEKFYDPSDDNYVLINPRELFDSLTRVNNFSEITSENNKLVKFDITDDFSKIRISSENDFGGSEEENDTLGDNINFVKRKEMVINSKLNPLYLSSILQCTDKTMKMFIKDSKAPNGLYNTSFLFFLEDVKEENTVCEKQLIIVPSL